MNVNNQMYRMFKEMKEGYANNNIDQMEHGARCWLELDPKNPFPESSEEMEAFFQMQKCYNIWKRGDIDRKINRRKMIMWAEKLCELNPRQPYHFDKKAEEEEIRLAQEAEKLKEAAKAEEKKIEKPVEQVQVVKTVIEEEPKKLLGIVPEEKKSWFKFLFPWKKEGAKNDGQGAN